MNIITKSDLQKNIAKISDGKAYTVINRGKPEAIIIPYFEGSHEWVEDYLEEFEILQNQEKLRQELESSAKSGMSDLVI